MPASSVPTTVSSEPPRGRCLDAHFRRQVTFETFGVAMYTPPPPDPPDCPEAAAGAAIAAHRASAQAPRFAGRRLSRKLLRPLFVLGPTGLADGLAPEERRYHRDDPVDSPLAGRASTPCERFPRSPGLRRSGPVIRQAMNSAAVYPRFRRLSKPGCRYTCAPCRPRAAPL